ncbi:MAG: thiol-disulfide oxidoreductase DCC family protein [Candidatus Riflebacteria bacterium]|nr:thiol-disulfide oxidoreductase DCC family protein [Candidatus Riflebacteria bacterium]
MAGTTGSSEPAVVLFDGVCNLCSSTVNFIIDRDPRGRFRFGSLQSPEARPYLERCGLSSDYLEGIVLIEGGRCFTRSTAVLRIARRLAWPWWFGALLLVVPRPIRDLVYGWVAARRYRWFGHHDSCRLPTPELASRFLPRRTDSPHPRPVPAQR